MLCKRWVFPCHLRTRSLWGDYSIVTPRSTNFRCVFRCSLALHDERTNKHKNDKESPSDKVPTFLMDREGVSRAKVSCDNLWLLLYSIRCLNLINICREDLWHMRLLCTRKVFGWDTYAYCICYVRSCMYDFGRVSALVVCSKCSVGQRGVSLRHISIFSLPLSHSHSLSLSLPLSLSQSHSQFPRRLSLSSHSVLICFRHAVCVRQTCLRAFVM